MRAAIFIAVFSFIALFAGCLSQSAQDPEASVANGIRQPVLVELFTSEGCSSCPPADKVLTILQHDQLVPNADVIALGFHVDYWDRLGWKDRFSSAAYTQRQEAYARQLGLDSTYTPQMVVDGTTEFVGSNRGNANSAIAKSAASPKGAVYLKIDGNILTANVSDIPAHKDATVYLAVAENNISIQVGGGENTGETLEHNAVVRDLATLGTVAEKDSTFKIERELPEVKSDSKKENLVYVVFVQDNSTLKILAVKQIAR